jgi:hypothetical protein
MKLEHQQNFIPAQEDEDEYTLCAFGDISLSNTGFVPGPLAALSSEKKAKKVVLTTSGPVEVHLGLLCKWVSSEIDC